MRLVSFGPAKRPRAGLVADGTVLDLAALGVGLPSTLEEIVRGWERHLPALRALRSPGAWPTRATLPLAGIVPRLPLRPRRLLGTGTNYRDHVAEMRARVPDAPSAFVMLPGSEAAPGEPLRLGPADRHADYEGEIALVIGQPARDVAPGTAAGAIAGLMLANDLSRRDVPAAHIVLAKSGPGMCPLGPYLVTTDDVDMDAITFTVHVNGELRQSGHTGRLVHRFVEIVASYSRALPLEPGDVILTGTPSGVGVGRDPATFLGDGDEVVVSSPQLGVLRTPIVRASGATAHTSG